MAPKFVPPVSRVDRGKSHYYVDGNGRRIPGVTTILGALPKDQLITWAANATAEGAVDNWDELSDMPVAQRLKTLQRIRYGVTNAAKNRGTKVHDYAARLVQGEEVSGIEDCLRGHVENYVRWIDSVKLDPMLVEVVVVNYTYGYAGTLDLIAKLTSPDTGERETWLLDIKTSEKRIYPGTALQLAAYRYAETYLDSDGSEHPYLPPISRCGAVHVTDSDAVLVPTKSGPDQLNIFRHAARIARFVADEEQGLVLNPLSMPRRSTARVVWEELK